MAQLLSVIQRLTTSVTVAACSCLAALAGVVYTSFDGRADLVVAFAVIAGYCLAMTTVLSARTTPTADLVGRVQAQSASKSEARVQA